MADILVLVIIADAAQNGMSGEYRSVTEGAILVGTIIAWNVILDWLTYKSARLQKILEPPPLLLVDNGRVLTRNLRVEFVSEDELRSKLREHGVTDYAQVAKAYMEPDGEVSVIKREKRVRTLFSGDPVFSAQGVAHGVGDALPYAVVARPRIDFNGFADAAQCSTR